MEIIPAVIPNNKKDLLDHIERVRYFVPIMQIDVCDGRFVPSVSWPYTSSVGGTKSTAHDKSRDSVDAELVDFIEEGMPYWETLDYEIDMMVSDPAREIERWISAGAKRLIVHVESIENFDEFFTTLANSHGYTDAATFDFFELGAAFSIETPLEKIAPYISKFHFIQLMSIDNIGYQARKFDPKVLQKIAEAKKLFPGLPIAVDGGVNLETAPLLIEAGADRLVAGSAIFKSGDISEAIQDLANS